MPTIKGFDIEEFSLHQNDEIFENIFDVSTVREVRAGVSQNLFWFCYINLHTLYRMFIGVTSFYEEGTKNPRPYSIKHVSL